MLSTNIFYNTITIYLFIAQGFVAGKYLNVSRTDIATTLFYLITPFVFLFGIAKAKLDPAALMLPVIIFFLCSSLCLITYYLAGYFWQDRTKNILAFSAGNANAGYFGTPIALMIFDEATFGIYITTALGITIFENSIGMFISSIGQHTTKESIVRIIKLPVLWGAGIGFLLNFMSVEIPHHFDSLINTIRGAFVLLGMMVIGLGLSGLNSLKPDLKFLSVTLMTKYLIWPIVVVGIIFLDSITWHFLSVNHYNVLLLISIMPIAANTVIIATLNNIFPEKMALAVVLSMIIALFYVPFMISKLLVMDL